MKTDLDTLLIALYVLIDDHVVPPQRRWPGRPKKLSDAELVCLAVAQVLLGARSEHHWLRMCYARLGHLFRYVPKQPGYHKRLTAAAPLICKTMQYLATLCPSWADDLRLIDATPVPCGSSRETVKRSELAGWANYGYCAAYSRWYWGLKLYLIATTEGMPVAWCLADPKLGETKDGYTPEQRFFLGFGRVWCQKQRPELQRMLVNVDPHSPGRYRVNGVVQNMPEFEQAWSCKPGQPMVAENACRVW